MNICINNKSVINVIKFYSNFIDDVCFLLKHINCDDKAFLPIIRGVI